MIQTQKASRGSGISLRRVAAVISVATALVVGAAGGYAAKTLSLPGTSAAVHIVAGQGGSSAGTASSPGARRGGTMSVEGPAAPATPAGAAYRAPGSREGGPPAP